MKYRMLLLVALSSGLLAACDPLEQLKSELAAVKTVLTGGHSPLVGQKKAPPAEYQLGEAAKRSQANGELLHEVFQVALLKEPLGTEFAGYVNVMNQGASLEGLYNGFTHSSEFRRMEFSSAAAAPETLRRFSDLLVILERELPEPTVFDASSAKPLQLLEPNQLSQGAPKPKASAVPVSAEAYLRNFEGASFFTLKRVIGDEALKVVAHKAEPRPALAKWYGKWAVALTAAKVDFGLAPRNRADESFHESWALKASEDQIRWEVLNRVHRILNDAEKRVPVRPQAPQQVAAPRAE